jgi:hypothetical protein
VSNPCPVSTSSWVQGAKNCDSSNQRCMSNRLA